MNFKIVSDGQIGGKTNKEKDRISYLEQKAKNWLFYYSSKNTVYHIRKCREISKLEPEEIMDVMETLVLSAKQRTEQVTEMCFKFLTSSAVSAVLRRVSTGNAAKFLSFINKDLAASLLLDMDQKNAISILFCPQRLSIYEMGGILSSEHFEVSTAIEFLLTVDKHTRAKVLSAMPYDSARSILDNMTILERRETLKSCHMNKEIVRIYKKAYSTKIL